MKKHQLNIILIPLLIFCTAQKSKTNTAYNNSNNIRIDTILLENLSEIKKDTIKTTFDLKQWQDKFPFKSKIVCFNEDSISHFEEIIWQNDDSYRTYSAPIIGELAQQINGLKKLEPWHMEIYEGTPFLYSIQNRQKHVGITTIGANDWVTEIMYLSYDLSGQKMDEAVLATHGGDGGFYTKGHGCFINDTTYIYEYIETEYNPEKEMDEVYESGKTTYIIHNTGKIETKKNN